MKIQTMSIVVGSIACDAACPFCVSRTTGFDHMIPKEDEVNWRNFHIACRLAEQSGVSTVLLTGKGEPTLYPKLISSYLDKTSEYLFCFKELQTNGIAIGRDMARIDDEKNIYLDEWYALGLTTICVSMVHYESDLNRLIYQPTISDPLKYMNLDKVIEKIIKAKLAVRLSCILVNGYIDNEVKIDYLIQYCRNHGVKQLTIRPMTAPENNTNKTTEWIENHHVSQEQIDSIKGYLNSNGTPILELPHGATVFDVNGQNVCWSTCLTTNKSTEDIRQLIFYPDGTLSYDWKYKGAVLL